MQMRSSIMEGHLSAENAGDFLAHYLLPRNGWVNSVFSQAGEEVINVVGLRQHGLEIDQQILLPEPVIDLVPTSSHRLVVATSGPFLRTKRSEPDLAVGSEGVANLADP